jgi:hypothetical protein
MVLVTFHTVVSRESVCEIGLSEWNQLYASISVRRVQEFSYRIYGDLPLWF